MRLRQLSFAYGTFPIFENLSINLTARVTVLKGISGCGKTTLLKLLSGVLVPGSGEVTRPRNPCLVLQEDALFPWLTGRDNLRFLLPKTVGDFSTHAMYGTVSPFVDHRAHTMSFGQRRKIELFRAVLLAPPLLCLDEPFNYLDPGSRADTVTFLHADSLPNTQIVLSTHLDDDLSALTPETFRLDGGLPVTTLERQC